MNDMTDDGKWGAAIPIVDGKRPEWLEDDDVCALLLDGNLLDGDGKMTAANWVWGGTHQFIRLPASHPHYQQTQTQTQTLTAQERLERMEALVRRMAALNPVTEVAMMHTQEFAEARALVAEMEPVVDGDLLIAREIACETSRWDRNDAAWREVEKGCSDHIPMVKCALAAIRRGRELARGEG